MKKSLKIGDINNPSFPLDNWDINHTSLQDLFEIEPKAINDADFAFLEQFFSAFIVFTLQFGKKCQSFWC